VRQLVCAVVVCAVIGAATAAAAQEIAGPADAAQSAAPGDTTFLVENVTRAELWRFFTPYDGGGVEPDYAFVGNRSTLGARYAGRHWSVGGAIQYVRIENLPRGAIGPGLLGTGGAYFFQAAGTFSYQFYLRGLHAAFAPRDRRWSIAAGRLSLDEAVAAGRQDTPADALARERVGGRLLGDMRGSLYQRAWDGLRVSAGTGAWQGTVHAVLPTQGTFEESANLPMDRVRVVAADVLRRGGGGTPVRLHGFAYGYRDTREVHARPDNSGQTATAADVAIGTVGASAVATGVQGAGRWDVVVWGAWQMGDWYGQTHRAGSAVGEAGYQWTGRGRPWLRAGVVYASGDTDGDDDRHGTFFPLLPSGDEQVASNTYALMNVVDGWLEARLAPHPRLDVSADVHRVGLATGADRWYFGSGATERRGNYFGYLGRVTRGQRDLGTILQGTATWRPLGWWTLRGYLATFFGRDVVRQSFRDDRLTTGWVESVIRF